ncbi:hypothetical protein [Acidiferrobacter sp.]|uniref:hypothetical protein n=1 Tax=Acidiferrobacter sp. TaxID=1872107 RepID=UPI0026242E0A|nr:hypothetical protein [Acidiferrobacter sp.]
MPIARWLGPLGGEESRLAQASRALAAQNPRAFVAPLFLWIFLNANLAALAVLSLPTLPIPLPKPPVPGTRAGVYTALDLTLMVFFLIAGVALSFGLGWIIRWRFWHLRSLGAMEDSEPRVLTLTPGTWAAFVAVQPITAALLVIQILNNRMANAVLGPIGHHTLILGGFTTFWVAIRALAAYYRRPFLLFWRSIGFPAVGLIILVLGVFIAHEFELYREQMRTRFLAQESLAPQTSRPAPRSLPDGMPGPAYRPGPHAATPP